MTDEQVLELRNEIKIETAGSTDFEIEAFARVFARRLEDAEQIFDLNVEALQCRGPRGRKLELLGYAEDATDDSLTVLAGRYFGDDSTLTLTEAKDALSRATGFLESASDGWFNENLEPSSREAEYADYFRRKLTSGGASRIRVALITDGKMSERIRTIESDTVAGIRATFEIWDQRRIIELARPETHSEDIEIDFTRWLPDGLPCLIASTDDSSLPSYLAVLPARVLADVFEEHGSLLLESNVRTFLSARGAVNRGIQETLRDAPDRFLAFNNGLTTTAVDVEVDTVRRGTFLKLIRGWQIVNGGQTTASIAHYLRASKERTVDGVSVQMKLVVVDPNEASDVVHAVAKYANSQNRISGADLFSTHAFHVRMEQISRRLRAPAKEGQQYRSGWYYERARGQWENDRAARGALAEQKKFELEYPKPQRITKTDWAKYAYCWGKKPHLVSKGAQSVFADYALAVDKQWESDDAQFGDGYFVNNVGKAIMYEQLRSAVLKESWYTSAPGYLANIVAYAIARFALQIETQFDGAKYDFSRIWQSQAIDESTLNALLNVAQAAQLNLTDDSRPQANVTQWAKQQACWDRFSKVHLQLPGTVRMTLVSADDARASTREDRKLRVMDTGIENIRRVMTVPRATWTSVHQSGHLSPLESDLLQLFGLKTGGVPSEKQASALLGLLERMADGGTIARGSF
ncbi:AIPR family protein [Microbacterium sp. NPDC076911]|uniref:AIPR family protein n=1 Tax=Microbacterium sp. NPDC076911 TaxID=3154958 RepID=UPI003438E64E